MLNQALKECRLLYVVISNHITSTAVLCNVVTVSLDKYQIEVSGQSSET